VALAETYQSSSQRCIFLNLDLQELEDEFWNWCYHSQFHAQCFYNWSYYDYVFEALFLP